MIIIYKDGNLLIQDSYMTRSEKYGMVTHPLPKPYFDTHRGSLIVPLSPDFLSHQSDYTANHPEYKHTVNLETPLFNYNGLLLAEFTASNIKLHFANQDKHIVGSDESPIPLYHVVTYPYFSLLNHSEFAFTSNFNIRNELNILMLGGTRFDKLKEWVYTTAENSEGYLVTVYKKQIDINIKEMLYKITIDKPKDMDDTLLNFIRIQHKRIQNGETQSDEREMEVLSIVNGVVIKIISSVSYKPVMLPVYGDINVED